MTNEQIRAIALRQSALQLNARPEDFTAGHNVIVPEGLCPQARKYYQQPIACNLVSYGGNVVASVRDEYRPVVEEYLRKFKWYHCFQTPNLLWLDERMRPCGFRVCFQAEYFLPDVDRIRPLPSAYPQRILTPPDFESLYLPQWSNALCADRKQLDVLGVGAYDGDRLIGLAACSADCEDMWQIGVDVLPEYRRQGIAAALTSRLAAQILQRGKVPFYCCAWSNVISLKNALRSGFVPAWVEMTVKAADVVEDINK